MRGLKTMENNMLDEYKKRWFNFLSNDEFQAFIVISVFLFAFKWFGFIETSFFEKAFLFAMTLSFADNSVSTLAKIWKN